MAEAIQSGLTLIWAQFSHVIGVMIENPVLLVPVAFFVAGGAIGLVKRLIG